ncbi:ATP-binding protein [Alkaliphilus peptidifermentans]|uniref:histidine kinase n=1 Tax=Alkaliphilus peptidifermentans DSM 18978 TaxID=1120976 RepID=A0A1G5IZV5_9FIRM|nr:ATP-binding protein [Alkaliphilus peptidifermentans]SCY81592.1 His Kinase A (phospho-acceptor) domain-containing protein [Alkaliphilus peptidifermentans DSM 18978]
MFSILDSDTRSKILNLRYFNGYPQYYDAFSQEKVKINSLRIKIIAVIIIIVNIALLYIDITRYSILWDTIPNYKYLFYSHLLIIIFSSIYLCLINLIKISNSNYLTSKAWNFMFVVIALMWCVFLAINAQEIHGQISAYIIGIFCLASVIILSPTEGLFLYASTLLLFILGLFKMSIGSQELTAHIINGLFLTILAFGVTLIKYKAHANNFVHQKIITEKNNELNISHKKLEEAVKQRAKELMKSNEKLIDEINLRHVAEIEAIQRRLQYEEKERLLKKAKEYESLRNTFFANISHELKTPLNVILSAQQLMNYKIVENSFNEETASLLKYTKAIRQNCYRLIRLQSNLIDITKFDSGSFEVRLGNYDIVQIVEDITLSVVPFVKAKAIDIIFDTEVEEKVIACDPDKIERVLLNLISNAIKFTPENGRIYINIYDEVETINVSVKDTGIGIPIDMQEKVFDRFIQVNQSTRRKQEGSGIGLSLVKLIMEMHNGTVALNSREGEGSEFILSLPNSTISEKAKDVTTFEEKAYSNGNKNAKIEMINIEFSDIYI